MIALSHTVRVGHISRLSITSRLFCANSRLALVFRCLVTTIESATNRSTSHERRHGPSLSLAENGGPSLHIYQSGSVEAELADRTSHSPSEHRFRLGDGVFHTHGVVVSNKFRIVHDCCKGAR